ncbi:IclR family transcriptional regulator [Nocardia farcinica]|uniref:IclR family transcriptional regulator n=1 Tax=Nocardia farcinica TaxID=37329 RepID=UPI0018957D32|nr:IclR family transcriptional regulator [Nocardia farcinica]MBF6422769.1 IclR family transcriptional regulator [Nocardia farcinica]MBF6434489.1 IclR family transcriptional regulator [Nocardia farcinica]MBF6505574.1 IclR family transcriptional regulator [Nocardia farcinica]
MAGNTGAPGQSVAARTLSILSSFDRDHRALTLTQIAERAQLPLPTASRLVREIETWGGLIRREDGTFVIGRRLWDLGLLAPIQTGLRQVAAPFLQDLYAATLATVHLAVRDGDEVLYLDRLSGRASVPVVSNVGGRLPLYSTGVGKVLLAHAPDEIVHRVLSDLRPFTPHTIVAPGTLARQLRQIRHQGYATTVEEMTLGACSVAVPVDDGNSVIAAIGVVVPTLGRNRSSLIAASQVAAAGIGRTVQYR